MRYSLSQNETVNLISSLFLNVILDISGGKISHVFYRSNAKINCKRKFRFKFHFLYVTGLLQVPKV